MNLKSFLAVISSLAFAAAIIFSPFSTSPASADPSPPPPGLPTGTLKLTKWDFVEIDLLKQLQSNLSWSIQNAQPGDQFRLALYVGTDGGAETQVQTYGLPGASGSIDVIYQPINATNSITYSYDAQFRRGASGWQNVQGAHVYDAAPVPKTGLASILTLNSASKAPTQPDPAKDTVRMDYHYQVFTTWAVVEAEYRDAAGEWHSLGDVSQYIFSQAVGMRTQEEKNIPKTARDANGNQTVRLHMYRNVAGYPTLTYSNTISVNFSGS